MKIQFISIVVALFATPAWANLTVYTDRAKDRLANAATAFKTATGQDVVFVEAPYADLLNKVQTAGAATDADLIVTKDLIYLNDLSARKLLQPMKAWKGLDQVDPSMRDPNLNWTAITYRVRTLAYDPSRNTDVSAVRSFKDLAGTTWQGRLCLRSSLGGGKAYNEALASYLIDVYGQTDAKQVIAGWVKNLAAPVMANDTAVLDAIANGTCDVGIVNHYYLGVKLNSEPNFPVRVAFLEQDGKGMHTNGVGAGIIATSKKADLAQKFIEILLTDAIQLEFSAAHFDYPAAKHLQPSTMIKDWGKFKVSTTNWADLAQWNADARKMMDEAGYK